MPRIRMLNDLVIDKIAAGEVVERPSAAIKELIENSLDAGAKAITVEIRDGGISYFRVTDNGCGIPQQDIRMAFERHATSKITDEKDLNAIATLGFRGEALASIAAVGHVTCTTRTADDATGILVRNDGGTITAIEETACPEGTSIVVRDLFFNVPVRLKFLKKPAVEGAAVSDLLARMILSRPDVSFRYISGGKTLYHSAGDGKIASALYCIYGRELIENMRKVEGCSGGVLMKGYVGIGDSARSSRSHESFFINGRTMRSQLLSNAVEAACRERVMIGKYPVCALYLTMPYETVDVNVHPNKLEVRFQNEQAVYDAVYFTVRDALKEKDAFERPVRLHLDGTEERGSSRVTVQLSESVQSFDQSTSAGTTANASVSSVRTPVRVTVSQSIPTETQVPAADTGKTVQVAARDPAPATAAAAVPGSVKPAVTPSTSSPDTQSPAGTSSGTAADAMKAGGCQDKAPEASAQPGRRPQAAPQTEPPGTDVGNNKPTPVSFTVKEPSRDAGKAGRPAAPLTPSDSKTPAAQPAASQIRAEQVASFVPAAREPVRYIGKAFKTYILVEYRESLLMIDQHAVHERLLFDRMMNSTDDRVLSQELLVPIVISATRREQALISENEELLHSVGLTAEIFGEREIAVRSIPMILGEPQTKEFVRDLLEQLENEHLSPVSGGYEKKRAAILQTACKHAVKSGDDLSESDIRDLVERMIDQKVTPTCPHGRPLVIALSRTELDKRFKRIQG